MTGAALGGSTMLAVLKRMKRLDVTVHGLRASFRTWAAERTPTPRAVCEAALAHSVEGKTEAAYQRGDMFEKRRKLMQQWGAFCCSRHRLARWCRSSYGKSYMKLH